MSLHRRPASPSAPSPGRRNPRHRAAYRARVEALEDRRLLTVSATLSGTAATLTVGGGIVEPIAFTAVDGNLSHGALVAPAGESFADEFDFDSATEGSQRLAAAATSRVTVTGGDFAATLGSPTSPARSLLAPIQLDGGGNSSLVIDNSAPASAGMNELFVMWENDLVRFATTSRATSGGVAILDVDGFGGGVTVLGGDGPNRLTLDRSEYLDPITNSTLNYVNSGRGELALVGNPVFGASGTQRFRPTNSTDGTMVVDGRTVNYSGVGSVVDTAAIADTIIDLSGVDPRTVSVDQILDANGRTQARLTTTEPALPPYTFASKPVIFVNLGPGDSAVSVDARAFGNASFFVLDGGDGTDSLVFDAQGTSPQITPAGTETRQIYMRQGGEPTFNINRTESIRLTQPGIGYLYTDPIRATAGVPLQDVVVGRFNMPAFRSLEIYSGTGTISDFYTATIQWGDGTSSPGTIVRDPQFSTGYRVLGSHIYPPPGLLTIRSISVTLVPTGTIQRTINGVEIGLEPVSDYPFSLGASVYISRGDFPPPNPPLIDTTAFPFGGTTGIDTGQRTLGTIQSNDSAFLESILIPNNVNVRITWGDGSGSRGAVVRDSLYRDRVNVVGSHTYQTQGIYPVSVDVTSLLPPLEQPIQFETVASIGAPQLYETDDFRTVAGARAGIPFEAKLSRFQVLGQFPIGAQLAATIDWGDGTITPGSFVADPESPGYLVVTGVHAYAKPGTYTTQVKVSNAYTSDDPDAIAYRKVAVAGSGLSTVSRQPLLATRYQTFTGVIATFSSTNPLATADDFSSFIDWGDETENAAGVITRRADGLFEVYVTHVYSTPTIMPYGPEGYPLPPQAMSNDVVVLVTERGSTSRLLTFVPKTVSDAAIRAGGVTLSGIAGTPLVQALVGTFTYEGGPVPADQFFAKVDWGDGTIEDLPASALAAVGGSAGGLVYSVTAGHTYRNPGTYPVGVVISSLYNSVALAGSAAFIAPSLALQVPPLAAKAGSVIDNAVVATFVGKGDLQPATSYFALINWGDGTPLVPGTIAFINGTYAVLGTHVYANPGAYTLGVTLTENLVGAAAATGSVQVAPADPPVVVPPPPPVDPPAPIPISIPITGILDPASDSGVSNADGITNVNRPFFLGATWPRTGVTVYALPRGSSGTPVEIGRGASDADGVWRIQTAFLPDGAYSIYVRADSMMPNLTPILPETNQGVIVIDTVAPRVTDTRFLPLGGQVLTTFQDDRSGLAQAGLANPANYLLVRERTATGARNLRNAPRFAVNGVATTPGLDPAVAQVVGVTIDNNRRIDGGFFRYVVRAAGITDVAGNPLAGSFGGSFPTGGAPGADFAVELVSFRRRVLPVLPAAASVSNLTPAGQRTLGSIIASVNAGRITPERAATRIVALPRRGIVANAAKPTARIADRLLRRGAAGGN